jgi:hypothetical protein
MPALMTTRHADWVAQAAVALQRIAEHMTPEMEVLRGTFFGNQGVDLELQLASVETGEQLARALFGPTVRDEVYAETSRIQRGEIRRHLWLGEVSGLPVIVTAFEHVDQLPAALVEGARFPEPDQPDVASPSPAAETPEA